MVSVDTLEDNTKFAKEHEADFPILADPSKDTAKAYGVIRTDVPPERQLAARWTYYIGPDGTILATGVPTAAETIMLERDMRLVALTQSRYHAASITCAEALGVLQRAKAEILVMHPGPINRGVEISPDVADGLESVILQQVTNGVAVRMALLYLIVGGN